MWTIISTNRWEIVYFCSLSEKVQPRTQGSTSLQRFAQESSIYINSIQTEQTWSTTDYRMCPNCKHAVKFYSGKLFHSFLQIAHLSKGAWRFATSGPMRAGCMVSVHWNASSLIVAYRKRTQAKLLANQVWQEEYYNWIDNYSCCCVLCHWQVMHLEAGKTNWKTSSYKEATVTSCFSYVYYPSTAE